MRPNTPHVVYTLEPSVALGGHFYARSTIRDTCFAIYHAFISGDTITNASLISTSRILIARISNLFEKVLVEENREEYTDEGENVRQLKNMS